jgi:hypothetical protein
MRVFLLSVFTAIALAGVIGVTLTTFNPDIADSASSAVSVRLNDLERTDWYGRERVPEQTAPRS